VIQDELESQLSAMFDGELPATECELLSRRIDRDENLRARWSRYALIGAAMRSEPVATAPSGFARRVSAALRGADDRPRPRRGGRVLLNAALAATLVVAVAGLSISLLRDAAMDAGAAGPIAQTGAAGAAAGAAVLPVPAAAVGGGERSLALDTAAPAASVAALRRGGNGEPVSYVTPVNMSGANTALRTELADLIVAHSEYSTPLMRRNVLSALVSNEDGGNNAAPGAGAPGARTNSPAGAFDATTATPAASSASR
jgi:sigma-E factor negative regulatory protein RseA